MQLVLWIGFWLYTIGECLGLSNRTTDLINLSHDSPDYIVSITHGNLSHFAGVREYWTLITITSTREQDHCALCQEFEPVLREVGQRWAQEFGLSGLLFFANIDLNVDSNRYLFKHLNITSVPHIGLLPPLLEVPATRYKLAWELFDDPMIAIQMPQDTLHSERTQAVAQAILENLQVDFSMQEESQMAKFARTFIGTFMLIMLIKKKGPKSLRVKSKVTTTALLSIALVLIWISGFQWTLQNGTPFVAMNDKGGLIFVSGGTSYQFGIEIVLVSLLYALLAAATVSLVKLGQYQCTQDSLVKTDKIRTFCVIGNTALLFLLYVALSCTAKRKDHDYPYVPWHLF